MSDWKIIVTALVVLGVLAMFIGSTPEVSAFLSEIGGRISGIVPSIGIDVGEKGENEFSLALSGFDSVQFSAAESALKLKGPSEATLDKGNIKFSSASISGFTGHGVLSSVLVLNGSAESMEFDSSRLEKVRLALSSIPSEFSAGNVSIGELIQDAQGELVLNSSITKFSGKLEIRAITGKIFLRNGSLELEGKAQSIVIPSAGIRIG